MAVARRPPKASGALDEAYCLGHAEALRDQLDTQTTTISPRQKARGRQRLADLRVYLGARP